MLIFKNGRDSQKEDRVEQRWSEDLKWPLKRETCRCRDRRATGRSERWQEGQKKMTAGDLSLEDWRKARRRRTVIDSLADCRWMDDAHLLSPVLTSQRILPSQELLIQRCMVKCFSTSVSHTPKVLRQDKNTPTHTQTLFSSMSLSHSKLLLWTSTHSLPIHSHPQPCNFVISCDILGLHYLHTLTNLSDVKNYTFIHLNNSDHFISCALTHSLFSRWKESYLP